MEALWYGLLALMLTVYVVLDGFDLGAGMAHLAVARSDDERRTVLAAIGPYWDGNEVWLLASGGVLVFAFPRVYATAFSGFYLPLMIVLWLLILRGLSIELRGHLLQPQWRAFFDVLFMISSTLLAIVLGAALGNLVRGVPLDGTGAFLAPLFTDFHARGRAGTLDWYTLLVGVFAALTLAAHGAAWLAWKTEGAVQARSRRLLRRLWPVVALLLTGTTVATGFVHGGLFVSFARRAWAWPALVLIVGGLVAVWPASARGRDRRAFFGTTAFILGLLVATAAALFPVILRSTIAPAYDVTAYAAANGRHALLVGLAWWIPALLLAVGYFRHLFRSFAGKVRELHY